jgi:hypothetical protein
MSAFEDAIFRVYDRSMMSLMDNDDEDFHLSSKVCGYMEKMLAILAVFYMTALIALHTDIVGSTGCMPLLLYESHLAANRTDLLPIDSILQINISSRYKDKQPMSNSLWGGNNPDGINDDDWLGLGGEDTTGLGRKTRNKRFIANEQSYFGNSLRGLNSGDGNLEVSLPTTTLVEQPSQNMKKKEEAFHLKRLLLSNRGRSYKGIVISCVNALWDTAYAMTAPVIYRLLDDDAKSSDGDTYHAKHASAGNNTVNATFSDIPLQYQLLYDYEFSTDLAILSLSSEIRAKHNFTLVNITIPESMIVPSKKSDTSDQLGGYSQDMKEGDVIQCYGTNMLSRFFIPLGGVDKMIANNLVNTLKAPGMLTTYEDSYYIWHESDYILYRHAGEWISFKIFILIKTIFTFFCLSQTSALLVRVLISSGAIAVYVIALLSGSTNATQSDRLASLRHVSQAYPWLGLPIDLYAHRNQSVWPFIIGHISRIILYYVGYEAIQFSLSIWIYDNSQPSNTDLWLYSAMMMWE